MKKRVLLLLLILSIIIPYTVKAAALPNKFENVSFYRTENSGELYKLDTEEYDSLGNNTIFYYRGEGGTKPYTQSGINAIKRKFSNRYETEIYYNTGSDEIYSNGKCYRSVQAYCISPGLVDGASSSNPKTRPYNCERVTIKSGNTSNWDEKIYQYMAAIIKNKTNMASGNNYYVKAIALRILAARDRSRIKCGMSAFTDGTKLTDDIQTGIFKCINVMNEYANLFYNGSSSVNFNYFIAHNKFKEITSLGYDMLYQASSLANTAYYDVEWGHSIPNDVPIYRCTTSEVSSITQDFMAVFEEVECKQKHECDPNKEVCEVKKCDPTKENCGGGEIKTCTPDYTTKETVNNDIKGELNNCCEDEHNTVLYRNKLKDLFVNYDCLDVPGYTLKSGVDREYGENVASLPQNYCKLYCTEKIEVAQPAAFNIVANKAFKLNELTYKGVKYESPVVDHYRNCRLKIRFDLWVQDFVKKIDNVTSAYNNYVQIKRKYDYYKKAQDSEKSLTPTFRARCYQSGSSSCPNYDQVHDGPNCYPIQYENCSDGSPGPSCSREMHGTKNKKGKCNKGTGDDCKYTEYYTTRATLYSCYDNTEPYYVAPMNTSYTFSTKVYTYGTPYSYNIYKTANNSSNYKGNAMYNRINIVVGSVSTGNKHNGGQYSIYDGVGTALDIISSWESSARDSLKGTKKCAHSSSEVSAFVSCEEDYGVLAPYLSNYDEVNVPDVVNNLDNQLTSLAGTYAGAVNAMNEHIKTLETCQQYFANANKEDYNPQPQLKFYYEQAYLNDLGKQDIAQIFVEYELHCDHKKIAVVDPSIYKNSSNLDMIPSSNVDELESVIYSNAYGQGNISYKVFKCSNTGTCNADSAKTMLNNNIETDGVYTTVSIKPAFAYDATFNTLCYWTIKNTNEKFIVPGSGAVINNKTTLFQTNTGDFGRFYSKETVLSGTYQTYAIITNLGRNNVFDEYIKKNGQSCAEKEAIKNGRTITTIKDNPKFTCPYTIYDSESHISYCQSICVKEDCNCEEPSSSVYYAFRVADPNNLFPSCNKFNLNTKDGRDKCYKTIGNHSYNWLQTDEGAKAISNIQKANTFDPSNLTYSFKLDSNTMKAIKNYNKERLSHGGYEDFNLTCSENCNDSLSNLSKETNTNLKIDGKKLNSVYYNKACSKCYSSFLTNLASGKVGGTLLNKTIWNNKYKKSINEVRNSLDW